MKLGKFKEFFQSNLGQYSMSRLLPFMAFFPATWVLFIIQTESALSVYLGAYVLGYIGGKCADAYSGKGEK